MSEQKYIDLLIDCGALVLESAGEPSLTADRHSIGQDIKHAIMESGLARKLLAELSPTLRADTLTAMELLVEQDTRLVPGTVQIIPESDERIMITAATYEFGAIEVTL